MSTSNPSLLGFALLGLVRLRQPCSGYDLRKVFTHTPMGTFSDSPGAIYPALQRLEKLSLIHGSVENTATVRRRKLYRITSKGESALKQWLGKPVERADVIRRMGDLSLRFAFLEEVLGQDTCIHFLESLLKALASYLPTLHEHLKEHRAHMPLSASLALQSGIMGYESKMAWAKLAIKRYRRI